MEKLVALLFIIGYCWAHDGRMYNVKITEDGTKFNEKVKYFDDGCVEKITPRHNGNLPVKRVDCLRDVKYSFSNVDDGEKKTCYIHPLPKGVEFMHKSAPLYKSKFRKPKRGKRIVSKYVPTSCDEELNDINVVKKIEKYCDKGYEKVCIKRLKHGENVEKRAVEILKSQKDNRKRGVMLREFLACTQAEYGNLLGYINKCGMENINAKCKMQRHYCTYELLCPMNTNTGFWSCKYNHLFEEISCCDFHC